MTCPKCGTELPDRVKFCSDCGCKIDSTNEQRQNTNTPEIVPVTSSNMQVLHSDHSADNSIKSKLLKFWSGLSMFSKITTIAMAVVIVLVIIALCTKKTPAIVFSTLQLAGLIVAILINNGVIVLKQQWVKYIVLSAAILFTIINIASYSWGKSSKPNNTSVSSQPSVSDTSNSNDASVDSSVTDTPNSNIAPVDTSVTVSFGSAECIGKNYSDIESKFISAGFENVQTEAVEDLQNDDADKVNTVDTILINGNSDFESGQEFAKNDKVVIRYHTFNKFNNEITVDANASEYKYGNYDDVKSALEELGFTNIKSEVLYDIVFGITPSGEVKSVSIAGKTDFKRGDVFAKDAEIIITYHMPQDDDPSNITMSTSSSDYIGKNYADVEQELRNLGFTNIKTEQRTVNDANNDSKVYSITIGGSEFKSGDILKPDRTVLIKYYAYEKPKPVYYSTNDYETATKGNTGVFSYKSTGGTYAIYWIIDFDEGYVYNFTEGNGESFCDRLKIESGDLNSNLTITYHYDGMVWSYGLHFHYVNSPQTLIMVDNDGFENKYLPTDLDDALAIRNKKTITDY